MSVPDPPDLERLRQAFRSAPSDAADSATLDTAEIFDAVHGNLSPEARAAIVDRLVMDPGAAEAWRLAVDLAPPDAAGTLPATTPPPVITTTPWWKWAAVAASLVAALTAATTFYTVCCTSEPVYRSATGTTIASLLPEGEVLARREPVLRWTAIDGARYRVRVLSTALDPLVESDELATAEYRIPEAVLATLASGTEVLWQVEARAPDEAIAVSPTFTVRVE